MGGGVLYINSSVHISSYTHTGHVMHAQERSKCGFLNVHLANSVHTRQAEKGFCFFFYCDFFFSTVHHLQKRLCGKCQSGANLTLGFVFHSTILIKERLDVM